MKIQRPGEKRFSEPPEPVASIIKAVEKMPRESVSSYLSKIDEWRYGKSDLLYWVEALNRLDEILEGIVKEYNLTGLQNRKMKEADRSTAREIIRFERILVENSSTKNIFSSFNVIEPFIYSFELEISIEALRLVYFFASKIHMQRSIKTSMLLMNMNSLHILLEQVGIRSKESFAYYDEQEKITKRINLKKTLKKGIYGISDKLVPKGEVKSLMHTLRCFSFIEEWDSLLIIKLLAFGAVVYHNYEDLSIDSEFMEKELVEILGLMQHGTPKVREAAVLMVDALFRMRIKHNALISAMEAGMHEGMVMKLLKETVEEDPPENFALAFFGLLSSFFASAQGSKALYSAGVVEYVCSTLKERSEIGDRKKTRLVMCTNTFLFTIPETFPRFLSEGGMRILSKELDASVEKVLRQRRREVEVEMVGLSGKAEMGKMNGKVEMGGVSGKVDMRSKTATSGIGDKIDGLNGKAEMNDKIETDLMDEKKEYDLMCYVRAVMKITSQVFQNVEMQEGMRNFLEVEFPKAMKKILFSSSLFHPSVVAYLFSALASYIHAMPANLSFVVDEGLFDGFLEVVSGELPCAPDLLLEIANLVEAFFLDQRLGAVMEERLVLEKVLQCFVRVDMCDILTMYNIPMTYGLFLEEVSRHSSSAHIKRRIREALNAKMKELRAKIEEILQSGSGGEGERKDLAKRLAENMFRCLTYIYMSHRAEELIDENIIEETLRILSQVETSGEDRANDPLNSAFNLFLKEEPDKTLEIFFGYLEELMEGGEKKALAKVQRLISTANSIFKNRSVFLSISGRLVAEKIPNIINSINELVLAEESAEQQRLYSLLYSFMKAILEKPIVSEAPGSGGQKRGRGMQEEQKEVFLHLMLMKDFLQLIVRNLRNSSVESGKESPHIGALKTFLQMDMGKKTQEFKTLETVLLNMNLAEVLEEEIEKIEKSMGEGSAEDLESYKKKIALVFDVMSVFVCGLTELFVTRSSITKGKKMERVEKALIAMVRSQIDRLGRGAVEKILAIGEKVFGADGAEDGEQSQRRKKVSLLKEEFRALVIEVFQRYSSMDVKFSRKTDLFRGIEQKEKEIENLYRKSAYGILLQIVDRKKTVEVMQGRAQEMAARVGETRDPLFLSFFAHLLVSMSIYNVIEPENRKKTRIVQRIRFGEERSMEVLEGRAMVILAVLKIKQEESLDEEIEIEDLEENVVQILRECSVMLKGQSGLPGGAQKSEADPHSRIFAIFSLIVRRMVISRETVQKDIEEYFTFLTPYTNAPFSKFMGLYSGLAVYSCREFLATVQKNFFYVKSSRGVVIHFRREEERGAAWREDGYAEEKEERGKEKKMEEEYAKSVALSKTGDKQDRKGIFKTILESTSEKLPLNEKCLRVYTLKNILAGFPYVLLSIGEAEYGLLHPLIQEHMRSPRESIEDQKYEEIKNEKDMYAYSLKGFIIAVFNAPGNRKLKKSLLGECAKVSQSSPDSLLVFADLLLDLFRNTIRRSTFIYNIEILKEEKTVEFLIEQMVGLESRTKRYEKTLQKICEAVEYFSRLLTSDPHVNFYMAGQIEEQEDSSEEMQGYMEDFDTDETMDSNETYYNEEDSYEMEREALELELPHEDAGGRYDGDESGRYISEESYGTYSDETEEGEVEEGRGRGERRAEEMGAQLDSNTESESDDASFLPTLIDPLYDQPGMFLLNMKMSDYSKAPVTETEIFSRLRAAEVLWEDTSKSVLSRMKEEASEEHPSSRSLLDQISEDEEDDEETDMEIDGESNEEIDEGDDEDDLDEDIDDEDDEEDGYAGVGHEAGDVPSMSVEILNSLPEDLLRDVVTNYYRERRANSIEYRPISTEFLGRLRDTVRAVFEEEEENYFESFAIERDASQEETESEERSEDAEEAKKPPREEPDVVSRGAIRNLVDLLVQSNRSRKIICKIIDNLACNNESRYSTVESLFKYVQPHKQIEVGGDRYVKGIWRKRSLEALTYLCSREEGWKRIFLLHPALFNGIFASISRRTYSDILKLIGTISVIFAEDVQGCSEGLNSTEKSCMFDVERMFEVFNYELQESSFEHLNSFVKNSRRYFRTVYLRRLFSDAIRLVDRMFAEKEALLTPVVRKEALRLVQVLTLISSVGVGGAGFSEPARYVRTSPLWSYFFDTLLVQKREGLFLLSLLPFFKSYVLAYRMKLNKEIPLEKRMEIEKSHKVYGANEQRSRSSDSEDSDAGADRGAFLEVGEENESFNKNIEREKELVNKFISDDPELLYGAFKGVPTRVLDFDNKREYFYHSLRETGKKRASIHISVKRGTLFEESFVQIMRHSGEAWKTSKLNIKFAGEEGVDAGGLTREWFSEISKEMFNPNYGLFSRVGVAHYPNPGSRVNPEHLLYFKFIGRVIGKAVQERVSLDCYFIRAFYKYLLRINVELADIEVLDQEYFRSLKWISENPIEGVLDLTFSLEQERFGATETFDLKNNGRNVQVTDANKKEYVEKVCRFKLVKIVEKQLEAFSEGFFEALDPRLVRIFNEKELELLISGLPEIDVDDWRNNTFYNGYTEASQIIRWFWRLVRNYSVEDRAKLLQFVTGTSKLPFEGFAGLRGQNGVQKFQIFRVSGKDRLPSAHTCFNQLDLPDYDTYEILEKNLRLSFEECSSGFGFA